MSANHAQAIDDEDPRIDTADESSGSPFKKYQPFKRYSVPDRTEGSEGENPARSEPETEDRVLEDRAVEGLADRSTTDEKAFVSGQSPETSPLALGAGEQAQKSVFTRYSQPDHASADGNDRKPSVKAPAEGAAADEEPSEFEPGSDGDIISAAIARAAAALGLDETSPAQDGDDAGQSDPQTQPFEDLVVPAGETDFSVEMAEATKEFTTTPQAGTLEKPVAPDQAALDQAASDPSASDPSVDEYALADQAEIKSTVSSGTIEETPDQDARLDAPLEDLATAASIIKQHKLDRGAKTQEAEEQNPAASVAQIFTNPPKTELVDEDVLAANDARRPVVDFAAPVVEQSQPANAAVNKAGPVDQFTVFYDHMEAYFASQIDNWQVKSRQLDKATFARLADKHGPGEEWRGFAERAFLDLFDAYLALRTVQDPEAASAG